MVFKIPISALDKRNISSPKYVEKYLSYFEVGLKPTKFMYLKTEIPESMSS